MMLVALIVQIPDCICHVIYWSYLAIQTWPGALITNIWLGIQIACQIAASVLQGREEAKLRKQHPDKFPPTLGTAGATARSAAAATLPAVRVTFLMFPTTPDIVAVGTTETSLRLARPRSFAGVA